MLQNIFKRNNQEKDCPTCEVLKQEILYLQKIIDRYFLKTGIMPIIEKPPEVEEEKDEADYLRERGVEVHGD